MIRPLAVFSSCLLVLLVVGCTRREAPPTKTELPWLVDASAAFAQAKQDKKVVLMNFTGSDWCIWCKHLDREVFSTPEFAEYAQKNLVLLKLDFPQTRQLPPAERAQNEALMEKFQVEGFPTIIVLSSEGEPIGMLGYQPGGPSAWLTALQEITARGNPPPAADQPPAAKT